MRPKLGKHVTFPGSHTVTDDDTANPETKVFGPQDRSTTVFKISKSTLYMHDIFMCFTNSTMKMCYIMSLLRKTIQGSSSASSLHRWGTEKQTGQMTSPRSPVGPLQSWYWNACSLISSAVSDAFSSRDLQGAAGQGQVWRVWPR